MDDLLYILLGLAWIAFAFYRHSQKKKQRSEQNAPDAPHEAKDPVSLLEQLLTGKEEKMTAAPPFADANQTNYFKEFRDIYEEPEGLTFEEEYKLKGVSSVEETDYSEMIDKQRQVSSAQSVVNDAYLQDEEENEANYFDLRKAVIYSEILNRPYV